MQIVFDMENPENNGDFLKFVALADAGESIEFKLKSDGGDFMVDLIIYTGTEQPACFGPTCARALKGPQPYYSDAEIESFLKNF